MQSKNLFALDLGTTKFCIAALLWRDGNPRLEIVDVPAEGMHRGMVADFSKAERCLKELIEKAEKQMDVLMDRIIVGVAGSHLRSHMAEHVIPLNRQSCHPTHLKRLAEEVEAQAEAPFRELLHCVPISYKIDQREEIDNPLGFSGAHLHGRYFIIDSDKDYLKDVIRICNNNGLEVHRLYSEPFASASVSVDDEAKRLGLAIADIGGGTTDGIVFQNGKPVDAFTINIAGSMMTKDLAVGLGLPLAEAERIKHQWGLAYYTQTKDLRQQLDPMAKKVFVILGSRIHELGSHLANQLKDYKGQLGAGLLLTGGGSQVSGIAPFLADRFKVRVGVQPPQIALAGDSELTLNTRFATAAGLINLELGRMRQHRNQTGSWSRRYIDQFVNWIRELS
ncbi:MAG: cell division protein FtsA [Oligoflexus sp.]